MCDPGGDVLGAVIAERLKADQVEPALGLRGRIFARCSRREDELSGSWVMASLAQQTGARYVHADEDEGDVHAHERT